jgi:hypothetical protein
LLNNNVGVPFPLFGMVTTLYKDGDGIIDACTSTISPFTIVQTRITKIAKLNLANQSLTQKRNDNII